MFTNISRSEDNQAMKFGQLIEYSMRNFFLENSYTKCGRETIPRLFYKKSKLRLSLDQYSKVLLFCFPCLPSSGPSKVIKAKVQINCFYLI